MKKRWIYYIVPILVAVATYVGRYYNFGIFSESDAFVWSYSKNVSVQESVIATMAYFIPILLTLLYLIWMWQNHKKGTIFSFDQQIGMVMAIAFFLETFVTSILLLCFGEGVLFLVLYGVIYYVTIPLALLISYLWIAINAKNKRMN